MSEALAPGPSTLYGEQDQFVYLYGVTWRQFEALLAIRGDGPGPRLTYLEGTVELMGPSAHHEGDKTKLARLLEAYADELGIELEGYGSTTVKKKRAKRAAEADECYVVGESDPAKFRAPEIAIEVIWTSGGIPKLEVWRLLGAKEVWFWEHGTLTFHALRRDRYVQIPRSERLPQIEPDLLVRCMGEPSQTAAVRALRAALRAAR